MRVLFVAGDCPYPPDNGCRLRIFNLLKHLSQRHEITLVAPGTPDVNTNSDFDSALTRSVLVPLVSRTLWRVVSALASPLPFAVGVRENAAMRTAVSEILASDRFDLLHCEWMPYVSAVPTDAQLPKVYGSHNVEAVVWERYLAEERRLWMSPVLRSQVRKVAAYESKLPHIFDSCTTVSELDREQMRLRYNWRNVDVVPNGVDLDFYKPLPDPLTPTVAFVGSFDYRANLDAVGWFIESIWPSIRAAMPTVIMFVVGRRPPDWLRDSCVRVGISLCADVADTRPYLAKSALVVVPVRIGGGTRLKILEAMAAGRCAVSTTVGAEGLNVRHLEHLAIADDPADFAHKVVSLLHASALRQAIARTGRSLVEAQYGWGKAAEQMEGVWSQALRLSQTDGETCVLRGHRRIQNLKNAKG